MTRRSASSTAQHEDWGSRDDERTGGRREAWPASHQGDGNDIPPTLTRRATAEKQDLNSARQANGLPRGEAGLRLVEAATTNGRSGRPGGECDDLHDGLSEQEKAEEHLPPDMGTVAEAYERGRWLLGLLVLQSTSSVVLDHFQDLLREHLVVTLFLTMLVGAGGNAGNQSAIKVIRGLATGLYKADALCASRVVWQQAQVGLLLAVGLSMGGFTRVAITSGTDLRDCVAISGSLFMIVMSSVLLGSTLPFGLYKIGVDPAHAGTTIQVLMDILGVATTCVTCSLVLDQLNTALFP